MMMTTDEEWKVLSGRVRRRFYQKVAEAAGAEKITVSKYVIQAVKEKMGEA